MPSVVTQLAVLQLQAEKGGSLVATWGLGSHHFPRIYSLYISARNPLGRSIWLIRSKIFEPRFYFLILISTGLYAHVAGLYFTKRGGDTSSPQHSNQRPEFIHD